MQDLTAREATKDQLTKILYFFYLLLCLDFMTFVLTSIANGTLTP